MILDYLQCCIEQFVPIYQFKYKFQELKIESPLKD